MTHPTIKLKTTDEVLRAVIRLTGYPIDRPVVIHRRYFKDEGVCVLPFGQDEYYIDEFIMNKLVSDGWFTDDENGRWSLSVDDTEGLLDDFIATEKARIATDQNVLVDRYPHHLPFAHVGYHCMQHVHSTDHDTRGHVFADKCGQQYIVTTGGGVLHVPQATRIG